MSDTKNVLLALDLVTSLASRLLAVVGAMQRAEGEGRPISDAELDDFAEADDRARDRLNAKIQAKRAAPPD